MFNFFRRRQQEPRIITPAEAREIVEQKLRDPTLSALERGVLKQIAAQCRPVTTPSPLLQRHDL